MPSGGSRPGAGRKAKAEKYEQPVNAAEQKIVDKLPKLVDNLLKLANGGYQQVTVQMEPAGLIVVGAGDNQALAYPHLPPEQLVEVKRTVTRAAPDRAANQYLVDRIMGKPIQHQELSGPDGGPIEVDGLSDTERAARIAALVERAGARRAGQAPSGSEPD